MKKGGKGDMVGGLDGWVGLAQGGRGLEKRSRVWPGTLQSGVPDYKPPLRLGLAWSNGFFNQRNDLRLLQAAQAEGLTTFNPETGTEAQWAGRLAA